MPDLDQDLRVLYKGHLLSCRPAQQDEGRYQARVTIICASGQKTVSQHFLDLESFASFDDAVARAHAAGVEWVDAEWQERESLHALTTMQ